ncbi:MAG: colanic acid biosynthesis glycosyltransferase WcaL, partial [Bacillus sp. (in: Bacteria)]|nr:colanic acid biosynthesis glycosyltransferase WcaL [Bacillus sp. (in: firmicutes)]
AQKLMQLGLLHGKLYTTFHGYDMLRYVKKHGDSVYEELFQSKHTQLPISEYWKNRCEQLGAKSKHTIVHHMGIDVGKFEYCPAVQEKEIRVLSVARFVEKKGIEYGISAVSQLIDQGYSIQYSIVGGGPLEEKLRTMIQEKHLEKHIHMLGWKTQNELIDIMKKAHIILLPSVTSQDGDMEGIPVLLMEAMAMGKIVVSTYHSGIPELIRHNDNGFLVEERDVEGLVRTLQIVITTPENWQRITENARKTVLEDFNIERLNNQLIDLFKGNYSK